MPALMKAGHAVLIAVLDLIGISVSSGYAHDVSQYAVTSLDCREHESERLLHAFRSLHVDGLPRLLVVDSESFETRLIDPKHLDCEDPTNMTEVNTSLYGKALAKATSAPFPMRNDGIIHSTHDVNGIFLTADLCPASKERFEYRLFDALETASTKKGSPIPIALSISGKWLRRHGENFDTIIQLVQKRKIDVTWVNHSDTHPYRPGLKEQENFLLESGVSPDREIENVEIELIRRGELPSIYFRFPGLVSSPKWIAALARHSLIPVGADAWIALGEKPKSGSIILVHGNGNEPLGVTLLLKKLSEIEAIGPFLPLSSLF
jgi:hypothetical protein